MKKTRFHKLTVWLLTLVMCMTFILSSTFSVSAINTYTITAIASPTEGGTVAGGGIYAEGDSVTVTAHANDGYQFDSWYENNIWAGDSASYTFSATENRELTAEFARLYTVTYQANNGTAATDSESVADGESLTLAGDVFTYGRCEIESWNTEADGSGDTYNVGSNIIVDQDITLYAQWVLPLNKHSSFSEGDYVWSGNAGSPYSFTMKNGAVLYASVIFPAQTGDDEVFFIVEGDCEIKGSIEFVTGMGLSGSSYRGKLTIKGNGTLNFRKLIHTGHGDTFAVETDVTVASDYMFIGASGGMDSTIYIKDTTLTLHDLTLLQHLTMEGDATLNIINGTASFHNSPTINLSEESEIYIGGNGFGCVLYKENGINDAFDNLITNEWLPAGYSFRLDSNGYTLYDTDNNPELDPITIKKQGYTVTFKDWDGSEIDTQSVSHGSAATAPANPTRAGWTFTGWDQAFDNVTGDLTIMAQYVINSGGRPSGGGRVLRFTVKFETNGGTAVESKTVARSNKLTEPTPPTKDGFTFGGWYTDSELITAYDFDTRVIKNFTLYAKWEKVDDDDSQASGTHDCPSLEFDDLDITRWYHLDTDYVIDKDIFRGTTKNTFTPDGNITRAMMITVLYRAEGEPEVTGEATFLDIDENAYYAKAVVWGQQNGIIKGYSEVEYAPEQDILREQIAAIMYRYAKYKGYDVSIGENTNLLSYEDFDEISEYAVASMQWAVGSGMIKGRTESTLNPEDYATRAEIAAMLHRFIEQNK